MSRRLPPLLATRYFEVVARHLSFTRAAEELHVTQGAISLQIRKLESFLKIPLFVRHARHIELTPAGETFHGACGQLLDGFEKAVDAIIAPNQPQTLIVNTLPTIAILWLMPRLAGFSSQQPGIEVRVVSDIRPVDIHSDSIDVALRVGRLPGKHYPGTAPAIDLVLLEKWDDIEADLLFPDVMVPVASRRWYATQPAITQASDFAKTRLIHTSSRPKAWQHWLGACGVHYLPDGDAPEYGHFYVSLGAALEQKGIALVPDILLEHYPGRNELVVILPDGLEPVPSAGDYYLLTHAGSRKAVAVQAFRQWLLEEAQRTARH
ncbi:MAG: LysR substrate-binding domain-containing protein [Castellaniella sp.]